jgi:hypothetical protein
VSDDASRQIGGYSTPPDQDDIDALRRWALDVRNRRDHPDTTRQIHRICNGVSTLRAEVMGLKGKLKRERAKAKKPAPGRALPPDPDPGPGCKVCGENDPMNLAFLDTYADTSTWRCRTCGYAFHTRLEAR